MKLYSKIGIENCIDLLILGDMCQAPILRAKALKIASQNIDKIESCKWKKSLIPHPTLLAEIIEMMNPKRNSEIHDD